MNENKLQVISKIFNDENIRTIWNQDEEKYYLSIVDVVGVLAESKEPRKYWNWLKNKVKKEDEFELSSITRQLKLKSTDGKYYKTDVTDIKGIFRIIQSIPSKNAEPFKQWLAKLGSERINETFDPSLGLQRMIDTYRAKGYDEPWIAKRIKVIQDRKKLTDVWKEGGVEEVEYAILTNEIYKTWSGMRAKEYKQYKGLHKENLRDNMDSIELILTDLSEETTKRLATKKQPKGLDENLNVARIGGTIAKNTRNNIEKELGEEVINKENKLNYKYIDDSTLIK